MKITIDTQHDTYEDIKKVLYILSGIIDKKELGEVSSNYGISSSTPTADTTNLMSMFDSSSASSTPVKEVLNTPPDFSSFLNIAAGKNVPEKRLDRPQIEVY